MNPILAKGIDKNDKQFGKSQAYTGMPARGAGKTAGLSPLSAIMSDQPPGHDGTGPSVNSYMGDNGATGVIDARSLGTESQKTVG